MEIIRKTEGKVVVIGISGRLDTTHFTEFENMLMSIIDDGNIHIAIDLSGLEYISSSGLRVFLMGLKRLNARGGKMALCCLQENIAQIFKIAGFNTIFQIFNELQEGIAYCGA
ncbi:MAG: STAS domain-containing protein [Lentimicrobiaceae bacterium]|nr:STAS domain-containing protein [Lentimicrobiaceae bacterium]